MNVLIVSKTHYSNEACVGGLTEGGESVRLKREDGSFPNLNQYEIGQIWDMDFIPHPEPLPHVETVHVTRQNYLGVQPGLRQLLLESVACPHGSVDVLYDGRLGRTGSGSHYVSSRLGVPQYSTGFWLPDRDLTFRDGYYHYSYSSRLKYAGVAAPVPAIPAGTLVRVSLARWWSPNEDEIEQRCYLQLSGWYV